MRYPCSKTICEKCKFSIDGIPTKLSMCLSEDIYILRCVSKMAIKQHIRHRNTLNSNLILSNLGEHCEFTTERCCLSLTIHGFRVTPCSSRRHSLYSYRFVMLLLYIQLAHGHQFYIHIKLKSVKNYKIHIFGH